MFQCATLLAYQIYPLSILTLDMNARDSAGRGLFELWRDALAEALDNLVAAPMVVGENKQNLYHLVHRWKHHHKRDHLLFMVSFVLDLRFDKNRDWIVNQTKIIGISGFLDVLLKSLGLRLGLCALGVLELGC